MWRDHLTALLERPLRGVDTLQTETTVPASIDRTFAFFSDARNLEHLTPPWLRFRIMTPMPIAMAAGTLIDYRIAVYGVRIPWRTRIDEWEPGVRFVDRQIAGPYLWWRHDHRFEAVDGGTRVTDRVEFLPRAAMLSGWLVRRDVSRIFAFRHSVLAQLLPADGTHRCV
jgi:ligand-binding SRPBCC domain-containing protein